MQISAFPSYADVSVCARLQKDACCLPVFRLDPAVLTPLRCPKESRQVVGSHVPKWYTRLNTTAFVYEHSVSEPS